MNSADPTTASAIRIPAFAGVHGDCFNGLG